MDKRNILMFKIATKKKEKSFEETLWDASNKLRGSVESSEYKHIVLSLIFLKFISDTFEKHRHKLIDDGYEARVDMVPAYTKDNVFYLPEESRWSFVQQNAKQEDIALKIDTALSTIEKTNKALQGALTDNYFSRLGLDVSKLSALIDVINNIDTLANPHEDVVGRVYEYFLSKFAIAEGKGKGEFYTPKSIVNLIAELIEPYKGKIYDPCCGSGGMFVQSMKFIENHKGNKKDVSVYGQEYTGATYKLAKMNLAIRGISANLGAAAKDTFGNDQHETLKADFIMANPPFNQKDWRASDELVDDHRWKATKHHQLVIRSEVITDFSDEIINLYNELREEMASFGEMGIDFEEKAFYDILISLAQKYDFSYPEDKLTDLAKEVKKVIDDKAKYTDWNKRDDIKAELHFDLIILLDEWGYPPIDRDEVYKEIFEQAENFKRNAA
jgi:methylase of polypeptide subunit release factors